jgi:hypothetical protein
MYMSATFSGRTPSDWMASTQKRMLRSVQNWPMRARSWRWPLANSTWERVTRLRARLGGGGEDFFDGDMPGVFRGRALPRDHDELHPPAAGDFHPGVNVGGVFDGGGDDAVAPLPVDAVGDDADSLAGVFHEGDFIAMAIEQSRGFLAKFFDILIPPRGEVGGGLGLDGVSAHRLGGGMRERSDAGMVEKRPLPQDGEEFRVAGKIVDRVHGVATYNT